MGLFQDGKATVHLGSLKRSFLQYSASLCSSQLKCSEIWMNHCCLLEGFTPELILVLWRLSVLNSHRLDPSPGVMLCNGLLEFAVSIPLCYSLFLFYYNKRMVDICRIRIYKHWGFCELKSLHFTSHEL